MRLPNGPAASILKMEIPLWLMSVCALVPLVLVASQTCEVGPGGPQLYTYEVVAEFPHDPRAFTQGLQHDTVCNSKGTCNEVFWESTGTFVVPATAQASPPSANEMHVQPAAAEQ